MTTLAPLPKMRPYSPAPNRSTPDRFPWRPLYRQAPAPDPVRVDYPPDLVRDDRRGHYRASRAHLLLRNERRSTWRHDLLAALRDRVHPSIPRLYYRAVLGHDLHISTYATLHVKHFHATQPDPFNPRKLGWWEDVGRVSQGKVTTAFRDFEIDQLQSESSIYGDFKFHEVGTSNQVEANTDTALITTTAIARATGTQVEAAADQYRSVASVTADTSETWQEHGLFNASSGVTLMDRSLISPTVAVVASDVVQFTYTLTKNAEA